MDEISYGFGPKHRKKILNDYNKTVNDVRTIENRDDYNRPVRTSGKKNKQNIVDETVIYNLPLLKGFHGYKKLNLSVSDRKKVFKDFGYNWFELSTASFQKQQDIKIRYNLLPRCEKRQKRFDDRPTNDMSTNYIWLFMLCSIWSRGHY